MNIYKFNDIEQDTIVLQKINVDMSYFHMYKLNNDDIILLKKNFIDISIKSIEDLNIFNLSLYKNL